MVKNDRTGEVIQTKYGKAKIVQYNSATDITVLFDGYGIKQHFNIAGFRESEQKDRTKNRPETSFERSPACPIIPVCRNAPLIRRSRRRLPLPRHRHPTYCTTASYGRSVQKRCPCR